MICKKHPKYKAIRKPIAKCLDCWNIFLTKKIEENSSYLLDFKDVPKLLDSLNVHLQETKGLKQ